MDKKYFELKEEHIKLLSKVYVKWINCEFGAPAIDYKRPYGNSDVYNDIAKILNIKPDGNTEDDYQEFSEEQLHYMYNLHKEIEYTLEIILHTQSFETGFYQSDKYSNNWTKVKSITIKEPLDKTQELKEALFILINILEGDKPNLNLDNYKKLL
jgi:hypothetical protein